MNDNIKLFNSQSNPALDILLSDNYNIDSCHFDEWVKGSSVDSEIVKLNVRSVRKSKEW